MKLEWDVVLNAYRFRPITVHLSPEAEGAHGQNELVVLDRRGNGIGDGVTRSDVWSSSTMIAVRGVTWARNLYVEVEVS